jgi:hypothetical protein
MTELGFLVAGFAGSVALGFIAPANVRSIGFAQSSISANDAAPLAINQAIARISPIQ